MPPSFFQFTQSNLQDYLDCPRRFELRHILHQKWPALHTEPELEQEKHVRRGHLFHQLVHQSLLGLTLDQLSGQIDDEQLRHWWENYIKESPINGLPGKQYPEFSLSAPFAGFRLLAKYDVLAIEPEKEAVIVDWKTSAHRPARYTLQERMQTHLYPFLLVKAGTGLNGGIPVIPEQVRMTYWFPENPENPEPFFYSTKQFQEDCIFLEGLISEIQNHEKNPFLRTPVEKLCKFCVYRSLCDRGTSAGMFSDWEEGSFENSGIPLNLDFEQIGEIEF